MWSECVTSIGSRVLKFMLWMSLSHYFNSIWTTIIGGITSHFLINLISLVPLKINAHFKIEYNYYLFSRSLKVLFFLSGILSNFMYVINLIFFNFRPQLVISLIVFCKLDFIFFSMCVCIILSCFDNFVREHLWLEKDKTYLVRELEGGNICYSHC